MTRPTSNGVELALRTQMLLCGALPADVVIANTTYTPTPGREYVEEDFTPATSTLQGLTEGGLVVDTGLYIIKWYGVANTGEQSINDGVDELLSLFPPGSSLPLADGSGLVVRIRGDMAPRRGRLLPTKPGFVVVVATIPYQVLSLTPAT